MYLSAKVVDIVLDSSHPLFSDKLGIGFVLYQPMDSLPGSQNRRWAAPLMPSSNPYPLVGEYVLVFPFLMSANQQGPNTLTASYYIGPINIQVNPGNNQYESSDTEGYTPAPVQAPLAPRPGDVIWQGRHQQSLRFGSDKDGHATAIWSIGGRKTVGERTETLDQEATTIIQRGSGTIDYQLAYSDFTDYDPATPKDPVLPIPDSTQEDQVEKQLPYQQPIPYPVNEDAAEQGDNEMLKPIEVQYNHDLPSGSYTPIPGKNPIPITVEPRRNISTSNFDSYTGSVDKAVQAEIAALLDVISFAEGTLGQGQNGYDIIVGYGGNKSLRIGGWSPNYTGGHPFPKGKGLWVKGADGQVYHTLSTASGRYQFLAGTWSGVMGSRPFNKKNQDIGAGKKVSDRLGRIQPANLPSLMRSATTARTVIDALAPEWDSFPYSPNGGHCYPYKPGVHSDHHRLTVATIMDLYNRAYAKYARTIG